MPVPPTSDFKTKPDKADLQTYQLASKPGIHERELKFGVSEKATNFEKIFHSKYDFIQ